MCRPLHPQSCPAIAAFVAVKRYPDGEQPVNMATALYVGQRRARLSTPRGPHKPRTYKVLWLTQESPQNLVPRHVSCFSGVYKAAHGARLPIASGSQGDGKMARKVTSRKVASKASKALRDGRDRAARGAVPFGLGHGFPACVWGAGGRPHLPHRGSLESGIRSRWRSVARASARRDGRVRRPRSETDHGARGTADVFPVGPDDLPRGCARRTAPTSPGPASPPCRGDRSVRK